jgi:hypothetical protein
MKTGAHQLGLQKRRRRLQHSNFLVCTSPTPATEGECTMLVSQAQDRGKQIPGPVVNAFETWINQSPNFGPKDVYDLPLLYIQRFSDSRTCCCRSRMSKWPL